MNTNLKKLQPYPFQRLRDLFKNIEPNNKYQSINLSIGEPKHDTPQIIKDSLAKNLAGLSNYPTTIGVIELRQAIASWISRRYAIPPLDIENSVIPVNGSREALFAFAQAVINQDSLSSQGSGKPPIIICPNPFYQIYEGAAFLAGAEPYFLNTTPENNFSMDFDSVPEEVWSRTQLVYLCSPGNPSGKVMTLDEWKKIFELSDRYGFTIASDECYSEIYFVEGKPPLGALQAAHQLGRSYRRLVAFSSLSKRSNVPGMRSGFVAGDHHILEQFLLYRTYHGCAMSPCIQAASITAWNDESHVIDNRQLYAKKFSTVTPILQSVLDVSMPDAAFYLWARTKSSDTEFAIRLYRDFNLTVLPGSFLARDAHGFNPGENFIRIALVASLEECLAAAQRISDAI